MSNWLDAVDRSPERPEHEEELHQAIDHMISVSIVLLSERWLPNSKHVEERRERIAGMLRKAVDILEKRPP